MNRYDDYNVDVIVIGSGPSGLKAAFQLSKSGKRVAIIEKNRCGGAALNTATIPSKTFREAVISLEQPLLENSDATRAHEYNTTVQQTNRFISSVIQSKHDHTIRNIEKNNIRLFYGSAHFIDEHTIEIDGQNKTILTASFIIIATGSRPRHVPSIPVDHQYILDSISILSMDERPDSFAVIGGGIIGIEYASFISSLGIKVSVFENHGTIMPWLDREVVEYLYNWLKENGIEFIHGAQINNVKAKHDRVEINYNDNKTHKCHKVLCAMGRTPNIDQLNLSALKIELDKRGHIIVNDKYQTNQNHIYAVGDVIGPPSLASTSMEQGRHAAMSILNKPQEKQTNYPYGVYTIPEVSMVGVTQQEMDNKNKPYVIARAYYYELARASINSTSKGLLKMIICLKSRRILGVHIVGKSATELIHIGQLLIETKQTIDFLSKQVFNYPTFAEAYKVAALNGLNKMKEL